MSYSDTTTTKIGVIIATLVASLAGYSLVFLNSGSFIAKSLLLIVAILCIFIIYRKLEDKSVGINKLYTLSYSILAIIFAIYIVSESIASGSVLDSYGVIFGQVDITLDEIPFGMFIAFSILSFSILLFVFTIISIFKDNNLLIKVAFLINTIIFSISAVLIVILIEKTDAIGGELRIDTFDTAWYLLIVLIVSSIVHFTINMILDSIAKENKKL